MRSIYISILTIWSEYRLYILPVTLHMTLLEVAVAKGNLAGVASVGMRGWCILYRHCTSASCDCRHCQTVESGVVVSCGGGSCEGYGGWAEISAGEGNAIMKMTMFRQWQSCDV